MADIVIRGIEMPKDDLEYVSLWVYGDGRVYVSNKASAASSQRLQDLAVPLPEKHGRLIDADALDKAFTSLRFAGDGTLAHWDDRKNWCLHGSEIETILANAPTIVPAEGGENE